MENQFINLQSKRRTIYALGKDLTQSNADIVALIEAAIKNAPSAFNNQTVRAVILFNQFHDQLWDMTADRLKSEVPTEAAYQKTVEKLNGFKAAYGTVLYFTDTDVVKQNEADFPLYAANFADWAEQAQGNAQFSVWTALAEDQIGANLQHYNPLIDAKVADAYQIPANWTLRAEMPFGSIEAGAGDKDFMADADRFKIFE
ncbi:nitroreductase family protein [Lactiplantibacillus fabifermentans]|uniref:Nitroreductase family protein n=1 Tax=Lactiplantibacillus fabifermentans DSM 21115 TaxID=1413187 RepID=A0A0R2NMW8_9LACO|nr:nitroreductase family protein [Lactiplantibacillus fabifermentans]KRO27022.1 nitroreductase family protein [Lactiplantibacillus fabifermentans DSM 21115]